MTLPGDVRDLVVEMSLAAGHSAQNARCAIERGDPLFARQMEQEDGRMNILHRELFEVVMQPRWPHGCAAAADLVLIGRFYERFADHAVDIARQVYFKRRAITWPHCRNRTDRLAFGRHPNGFQRRVRGVRHHHARFHT